eukprot:m.135123 g.135123  ORF g.135123 m.135123 type:complete len:422 (+) comp16553_c0_seq6:1566-2831(+)
MINLLHLLQSKKFKRLELRTVYALLLLVGSSLLSGVLHRNFDDGEPGQVGLPGPANFEKDFVIVTYGSAQYFERVSNLVGSIHYWEPGQKVLLYDLGLSQDQLDQVACWANVEVRQFNFSAVPLHVRNLYTYAWKPLVIQEALQMHAAVLVLDGGAELRQSLAPIKERLLAQGGFFSAQQSNTVGRKTHPDTFAFFKQDPRAFDDKPFCAANVQAYIRDSRPARNIVPAMAACALDEDCIAPAGSGRESHNYDQSVLSILAYQHGHPCTPDPRFAEGRMHLTTWDETFQNNVVMALRRWQLPGPYSCHLHVLSQCTAKPLQATDNGIVENFQAAHLSTNSPLSICLRANKNSRTACRQLQREREYQATHSLKLQLEMLFVRIRTKLYKLAHCHTFYLSTILLYATLLSFVCYVRGALASRC